MRRNSTTKLHFLCTVALTAVMGCQNDPDLLSSQGAGAGTPPDISMSHATVVGTLAENSPTHEDPLDYDWDIARAIPITLDGASIIEYSDSVMVSGMQVTIKSGGVYRLSGSIDDGQIVVDTDEQGPVWLLFDGVNLDNSTTAPVVVAQAVKVILVLMGGTENTVTDASTYVFADSASDEPNAAIFSKTDLTICGGGTLTVHGRYNDGIASKDGLIIAEGTIVVSAKDDGIRGKDYLVVKGGTLSVTTGGDGLKADNDDNATKGYIYVESGTLHITSGGDGFAAASDVVVAGGSVDITSGGGSGRPVTGDASAKAIKGNVCVVIDDGVFSLNAADDAIHSNASIIINGGVFTIGTADDAIHADSILAINDGTVTIGKCYEGLESAVLVVNGGNIHIIATDDGINGAGGVDGSGQGGWPHGPPPVGDCYLYITGGYIAVTTSGDGLDVNGTIVMSGGTVLVHGPTSNMDSAIDFDVTYTMTGGLIVAAGSSGMAQAPSTTSTQYVVMVTFSATRPAATLFHVQTANGEAIMTYRPAKPYQSVVFSSPKLTKGTTYEVYLGGSSSGTETDGFFTGGTVTGGTKSISFTISGIVTRING